MGSHLKIFPQADRKMTPFVIYATLYAHPPSSNRRWDFHRLRLLHISKHRTVRLSVVVRVQHVDLRDENQVLTSLSNCLTSNVICLTISRGASSDSLTRKDEMDLGPLVSFVLNSLLLTSLVVGLKCQRRYFLTKKKIARDLPQDFVGQLWVVKLLIKNLKKFSHWFW